MTNNARVLYQSIYRHGVPAGTSLMERYQLHTHGVCDINCGFCKDEREELAKHSQKIHEEKKVNINK